MSVELLEIFGSDIMVCDAARVSYGKTSKKISLEKNEKLISFLAKHNHWSPFSHPQLQFRIKCPIYVERQLFKHQVGISVNSISGRYVDFSDTYSKINIWRKQSEDSKQGSQGEIEDQQFASDIEESIITHCQRPYSLLLKAGVCKEQARTILPLNLNTEFIWTGSLYAFIRMCKQRIKDDVQKETREIVEEMLKLVKNTEKFTLSLKAYELGT